MKKRKNNVEPRAARIVSMPGVNGALTLRDGEEIQLPASSGLWSRESAKLALGTAMVVGSLASTEIVAPIVATVIGATLFMMAVGKIVDTVADALGGTASEPTEHVS